METNTMKKNEMEKNLENTWKLGLYSGHIGVYSRMEKKRGIAILLGSIIRTTIRIHSFIPC